MQKAFNSRLLTHKHNSCPATRTPSDTIPTAFQLIVGKMKSAPFVCCVCLLASTVVHLRELRDERDTDFWLRKGEEELRAQLHKKINMNVAKNVIFFLGDGMSIPTVTAARAYKGLTEGKLDGEGEFLSFEKFPYSGFSRTYCVDNKVADSACSATAYLRGVKGNKGTIGVNARVSLKDCEAARNASNRVEGIASWAQKAGKSTGFVTTTAVTDATPAGTFAHTAERDWECDADVRSDGRDPEKCEDVAKQLILRNPGRNFNVIMGGGARFFIPKSEHNGIYAGNREDGRNLIKKWVENKKAQKEEYAFVWNRTGLLSLRKPPNYLLGIFGEGNFDYRVKSNPLQPSLAEMTESAIKVLQKNKKGYFLLVEGGLIDVAHHASKAQISLNETLEFSKAVEVAVKMTREEDTLIVVTADHAHTMSISGYPERKRTIFGFSGKGKDGLDYSILNYANGPGFRIVGGRRHDMAKDKLEKADYVFPSGVPLSSETHGGDDVSVYARGPRSHIFTGSYEESYIAIAMAYAAGLRVTPNSYSDVEY